MSVPISRLRSRCPAPGRPAGRVAARRGLIVATGLLLVAMVLTAWASSSRAGQWTATAFSSPSSAAAGMDDAARAAWETFEIQRNAGVASMLAVLAITVPVLAIVAQVTFCVVTPAARRGPMNARVCVFMLVLLGWFWVRTAVSVGIVAARSDHFYHGLVSDSQQRAQGGNPVPRVAPSYSVSLW